MKIGTLDRQKLLAQLITSTAHPWSTEHGRIETCRIESDLSAQEIT